MNTKRIACLIVLYFTSFQLSAQSPSAILVMLKTENNKVEHFKKTRDKEKLEIVRKDVDETMRVMINDFTDHFQYCPVYYFADTNLQLIKDKKFDNVLFDKNRKTYKTSPIQSPDSNFFIVFYGNPPAEIKKDKNGNASYNSVSYPGKGLVVLNHQYKRLRKPNILYVYEPEIGNLVRITNTDYNYSSENFDIGYKQLAKLLQNTIKTHD